jgi:hypothetical protein
MSIVSASVHDPRVLADPGFFLDALGSLFYRKSVLQGAAELASAGRRKCPSLLEAGTRLPPPLKERCSKTHNIGPKRDGRPGVVATVDSDDSSDANSRVDVDARQLTELLLNERGCLGLDETELRPRMEQPPHLPHRFHLGDDFHFEIELGLLPSGRQIHREHPVGSQLRNFGRGLFAEERGQGLFGNVEGRCRAARVAMAVIHFELVWVSFRVGHVCPPSRRG